MSPSPATKMPKDFRHAQHAGSPRLPRSLRTASFYQSGPSNPHLPGRCPPSPTAPRCSPASSHHCPPPPSRRGRYLSRPRGAVSATEPVSARPAVASAGCMRGGRGAAAAGTAGCIWAQRCCAAELPTEASPSGLHLRGLSEGLMRKGKAFINKIQGMRQTWEGGR